MKSHTPRLAFVQYPTQHVLLQRWEAMTKVRREIAVTVMALGKGRQAVDNTSLRIPKYARESR
jgi:hypothetical protein